MTASINCSLSAGVVVTSDTSGSLALQANGTTIMTVSSTGVSTQVGAPAFSAYASGSQSGISSGVFTKVSINTENFDTNNNFDSSTNYRFTPTVAGYYQVNANLNISGTLTGSLVSIFKNGSRYIDGTFFNTVSVNVLTITGLVYCNGSTDYIEIYGYLTGTSLQFTGSSVGTSFSASMVRSA